MYGPFLDMLVNSFLLITGMFFGSIAYNFSMLSSGVIPVLPIQRFCATIQSPCLFMRIRDHRSPWILLSIFETSFMHTHGGLGMRGKLVYLSSPVLLPRVLSTPVLPKSCPGGPFLVAYIGSPGPYLSAKNGPALPKTVRYIDRSYLYTLSLS